MKTIILILAFTFSVLCDDNFMSKFHQNTFKVKDCRIQLISYDENYFNIFKIQVFKYNRTATVHNGTVNFKINMEDKIEVVTQAYKFLSNEYRHFPMRYEVNLKKAVDKNIMGLGNIRDCGNFTTFYFDKDITYFGCNFVIDETRFPPLIPNGKYKIEWTFMYLDEIIAVVYHFYEIYTPIKYPKK